MKKNTEYWLLWGGTILSFLIIYLTKIDNTPACAEWVYEIGQYLWFNLAISYIGAVIFYLIVVYIPEKRKQKKFLFQMGMDIQGIHLKGWKFFFYLRNAAQMQSQVPDTGKLTLKDIDKMLETVTPETIHKFINEEGTPTQTFNEYLQQHRIEMNDAINKALVIPYEDLDVFSALLFLQRTGIITGEYIDSSSQKFGKLDVTSYFVQLRALDNHFKKYYAPSIMK